MGFFSKKCKHTETEYYPNEFGLTVKRCLNPNCGKYFALITKKEYIEVKLSDLEKIKNKESK